MTFHNDSRVHRHDRTHAAERDSIVAVATDRPLAPESNTFAEYFGKNLR